MKKQPTKLSEAEKLRNKAEKLLKNKQSKNRLLQTDIDIIKINNELSVHQIELELQNEELVRTKNELEAAVEKYLELYEFAPSGYLTISNDGHIVGLNLSAAGMLGDDRRNLVSKKFELFMTGDSKPVLESFLSDIFSNKFNQTCEVTLQTGIGTECNVYLVGHLLKAGNQCNISMIDITLRKQAEQKLKETLTELTVSNKIKNEHETELTKVNRELERSLQSNADTNRFISILAHDLRTPFSVILGYSELLHDNLHQLNPSEIEKFADNINESTRFTFNLLEDLLKWARMQSGRIPFKPQKLNFKDTWKEISKLIDPPSHAKNISVSFSMAEEIVLMADSDMLKTVLRNLISNAIKYTNPGGSVKITAEQTVSNIIFSVSDNGIGIKPDHLSKIFDFSELRPTPGTSGEKGMGLGLFLCKGFVEKHGGKIWAESNYGKGSFFYFTIPVYQKDSKENIVVRSDKEQKAFDLKILVVDDNDSLKIILGELLKKYSRQTLFARTGAEAIDVYRQNPDTDLILMDFFMPEMNGYEATKQIRKLNNDVVIFVETSDTLSNIREEFDGVKINDFFPKPYSKGYLNELIHKHFSDKRNTVN